MGGHLNLKTIFTPPYGCQVRRGIGWMLVIFGLLRLLHLPVAGDVTFAWLLIMPDWVAPTVKSIIGLSLLGTSGQWRLRMAGYAATSIAFIYCTLLLRASYPSANGMALYGLFAVALLGEAVSRHECD